MTETKLIIRPARTEDIAAITAIYRRSVREETASFELEPPDEAEMLQRMAVITEAGYPYLVADAKGIIAGYAYASAFRPRPAYRHTVENTVYVAKSHWRQGVARTLLTQLISECQDRNFLQMIGIVGGADHEGSLQLHQSLGFEKVGQPKKVGFKHGKWLDTIYMQKEL